MKIAKVIKVGMFVKWAQRAVNLLSRLFKFLYIIQTFILAGTVCFYFQGSVEKTVPDHDIAGDTSQPIGETLRPVWGLMDKCYPVTTQRCRMKTGKKQAPEAMTPKAMGGLSDGVPKTEPGVLSQDVPEVRSPAEEAASPIPAGKEMAEEEVVAGTPGCEGDKVVPEETAVHRSEASEVERKEGGPRGDHTDPEEALARLVPSL